MNSSDRRFPEKTACALNKSGGVINMDQWFGAKAAVKLGATGSGSHRRCSENPEAALGCRFNWSWALRAPPRFVCRGKRRVGRRLLELGCDQVHLG